VSSSLAGADGLTAHRLARVIASMRDIESSPEEITSSESPRVEAALDRMAER
jgi:hypothetical protein